MHFLISAQPPSPLALASRQFYTAYIKNTLDAAAINVIRLRASAVLRHGEQHTAPGTSRSLKEEARVSARATGKQSFGVGGKKQCALALLDADQCQGRL